MKKLIIILILIAVSQPGFSQVGINTTSPNAQFDVRSSNQAVPTNTDGILIPKIDAFPLTNPTAAQNSMMVYLTTTSAGKSPGFYYWDNATVSWKGFGSSGGTLDDAYDFGGAGNGKTIIADAGTVTINGNDGLLATGTFGSGAAPPNGGGTKMFWFPSKAAFRAGYIDGTQWETGSIGDYSTAFGDRTTASGLGATAFGSQTVASGDRAVAFGYQTTASNTRAVAFGSNSTASGPYSTAFGTSTASGSLSSSFGFNTVASGARAVTFGQFTLAQGQNAMAFGMGNEAPSFGETVLGIGATKYTPSTNGATEFRVANATDRLLVVGNAIDNNANNNLTDDERRNALVILKNGNTAFGADVPVAKFQINASNQATPANTDGIIVPKIDAFPITNPTAAQNGMMVFLTTPANQSGFYYWDNPTLNWKGIGANTGWGLLGNAATDPAFNFIGTTDDNDVVFRRGSFESGRLGNNDTSFGKGSLRFNTGAGNTALGNSAMGGFISGFNSGNDNTAIGMNVLGHNTTGSYNAGLGRESLSYNRKGSSNTAFGRSTMASNTNASKNVALGEKALFLQSFDNSDTPFDTNNVAVGVESLYNNNPTTATNGINNTAVGNYSLGKNTIGYKNIALGNNALQDNTQGVDNVGVGYLSLQQNTSGISNTSIGNYSLEYGNASNNTALGYYALNHIGGDNNAATGYYSMGGTTMGAGNTGHGAYSLLNVSGTYNTALGFRAADATTSGNYNISIGANSDVLNPSADYQLSIGNAIYGDALGTIATARFSIGDIPSVSNKFYTYSQQLTANGDGQSSIYGYRTRDSQNDGAGYSRANTNKAVSGYNLWGDLYSFGVTGHCFNDFTRTGGVLGADVNGTYWSSLGYKNSAGITYGVYATSVLATGTGRAASTKSAFSIGGGFYGDIVGSWSRGNLIGSVNSGSLFASYNSGDEYTSGKQIELVDTGNSKTAAYTVTSTDVVIYKKGKIALQNGTAHVAFDADYARLLGDAPIVTTTPMGQCNGIYIESVDEKGFTIRELNNGTSNVMISWIAVGDRIDAQKQASEVVLDKDFDNNINEVMFNENELQAKAKAMWSDGPKIQFGELPENLKEKATIK